MATTLRNTDTAADAIIGAFLDKHFYPHHTTNFRRFNDVEHQMSGIDVQFNYGTLTDLLVDEKAAAHYINRDIPTFAFEINFLRSNGELTPGWFYDTTKRTQYYLLSWIRANISDDIPQRDRSRHLTVDNITSLDTLLINRTAIQALLESCGITAATAAATAQRARQNGQNGEFERDKALPYYFYYTHYLTERPVNIIVRKEALLQIATARHTITQNI